VKRGDELVVTGEREGNPIEYRLSEWEIRMLFEAVGVTNAYQELAVRWGQGSRVLKLRRKIKDVLSLWPEPEVSNG
jgi:hypothetical protein